MATTGKRGVKGAPPTLESKYDPRARRRTHDSGVAPTHRDSAPPVEIARVPRPSEPPSVNVTLVADRPRIEQDGVLGRGGMGAVHRVFDRNIRRYSAMKVLDPTLVGDASARRRFIAEGQITGQLEHPNIVPVYDLEMDAGRGAARTTAGDLPEDRFTMKLVEGETLASFLRPGRVAKRSDAELWELLNVFLRVCDAVAYAHSRGVVHRDLKPENVMVGTYGQVYVMDWGIAKVTGSPLVEPPASSEPAASLATPRALPPRPVSIDMHGAVEPPGTILGTPQYMAPEQAWGHIHEIDARTDVFALGAMLYHILTGRPPYRGSPPVEVVKLARTGNVRHPSEVAPGVPLSPALCDIAMKAMRAAREERYASVMDMKRDVERALRGGLWMGTRTFPAGTIIVREGDPSDDTAYIITKGRAAAIRSERGKERKLRDMKPGDVFGEMALLSSRARSATVVALEDVTAIVVTREILAREVPSESWLLPLVRTLVERFRELEDSAAR